MTNTHNINITVQHVIQQEFPQTAHWFELTRGGRTVKVPIGVTNWVQDLRLHAIAASRGQAQGAWAKWNASFLNNLFETAEKNATNPKWTKWLPAIALIVISSWGLSRINSSEQA